MKVELEVLQAALNVLDAVTATGKVPSSVYARLQMKGDLLALQCASETVAEAYCEVEGDWPLDGPFYVDRRVLQKFCAASKKQITFQSKGGELIIKEGRRTGRFITVDGLTGYMDFGKATGKKLELTEDDIAVIHMAAITASHSDVDPEFSAVVLANGIAYATDGGSVITQGPVSYDGPLLGIPLGVIDSLALATHIHVSKEGIRLRLVNGFIEQALSAAVEEDFPLEGLQRMATVIEGYRTQMTCSVDEFAMFISQFSSYGSSNVDPFILLAAKTIRGKKRLVLKMNPKEGTSMSSSMVPGGDPDDNFSAYLPLGRVNDIMKRMAALPGDDELELIGTEDSPALVFKRGETWVSLARAIGGEGTDDNE